MRGVPELALVTVAFHSDAQLGALIADWRRECPGAPAIIVNNGPTSSGTLRRLGRGRVRLIERPDNPGYGTAINTGIAQLPREVQYVVIANPDIRLEPGCIGPLVAELREHPEVAVVGPAIRDGNGNRYPSAREIPSLSTGIGHALFARLWPTNPWTMRYHSHSPGITARDCGWLSGAFLVVRRRAFDAVGGFDPGYFMYFEDVDLGFRLADAGWRRRYVPAVSVHHSGAHSTAAVSGAMRRAHHASAIRFLGIRYPWWWQAPVRLALWAGLSLRQHVSDSA